MSWSQTLQDSGTPVIGLDTPGIAQQSTVGLAYKVHYIAISTKLSRIKGIVNLKIKCLSFTIPSLQTFIMFTLLFLQYCEIGRETGTALVSIDLYCKKKQFGHSAK